MYVLVLVLLLVQAGDGTQLLPMDPRLCALKHRPRRKGRRGDGMEKMEVDEHQTASTEEKLLGTRDGWIF